ncbi:MAG: carboxypeptidase-like regulatory domain-containing protein [Acidobacteriota bacterium]
MRALVLCALVLCALAACTYPDKIFEGPFTCLGAPPPTTAKPLVTVGGHVVEPSNLTPISGAMVALQNAQMSSLFMTTTDASGSFSFTLNTNGTPAVGFDVFASASGRLSTYYYEPHPITDDVSTDLALLSSQEAAQLAAGGGVQIDATHGAALVTIRDCNGTPLAGATVTASAGVVRYFTGVQPSMTATATDVGGVALIAQLPPGQVTLSATVQGMKLPDHQFTVIANTFIQTTLPP